MPELKIQHVKLLVALVLCTKDKLMLRGDLFHFLDEYSLFLSFRTRLRRQENSGQIVKVAKNDNLNIHLSMVN